MSRIKGIIIRSLRYIVKGIPNNIVMANIIQLAPNELLAGRSALITGGTSGIGKEIARAFVMAGANVIIVGRDAVKIEQTISEIRNNQENGGGKLLVFNAI